MKEWMSSMLGKVAPGMCRLSMQGGIAIKTGDGYKSYDSATGRMVNCDNFVFPVGEEFFFVIPTNRVKKGDIIRVVTPGAGGYGDPKKRPVENVLKDVVEQKVSVEAAKSEYGVVVVPDGVSFRVDYEGTAALR